MSEQISDVIICDVIVLEGATEI